MSTAASRILTRYYQKRRACANENMARSTVRLLQSAIRFQILNLCKYYVKWQTVFFTRLSEAHARFMCHEEVTVFDAVSVVYLLETSMDSNGSLIAAANPLHTSFPDNPSIQYLKEAEAILTGWVFEILVRHWNLRLNANISLGLGLQDIWQEERKRVMENRGRKALQRPESFTQALIANETFAKPNPPQHPRSGVCREGPSPRNCDVTRGNLTSHCWSWDSLKYFLMF